MLVNRLAILLTRWQWALLFVAAPFLLFPTLRNSPVLLIIPLVWIGASLATKKSLPKTPVAFPLFFLLIMVLVSEFATFDMANSLPKIAGMALGLGMFYALLYSARAERGIEVGLGLFLVVSAGIAGLGLLGTNWFDKIGFLQPLVARLPETIRGMPGAESGFHPNEVAGALLWVLPVLLSLLVATLVQKSHSTRESLGMKVAFLVFLFLTVFVGGVFILTQSRIAFIALAGALFLLPGVLLTRRWHLIYLSGLAVLAIGLALFAWQRGWIQDLYLSTTSGDTSSAGLDTVNGRVDIWRQAISGIQDFPVTGMGMNVFRRTLNNLYPMFTTGTASDVGHAHNEFLTAALDLGIPGLVAFLALNLVSFWMLFRVWCWSRRPGRPDSTGHLKVILRSPAITRVLVLGLGGGLLAHAFYGMADTVALGAKPGILFWMLLGLIAGLFASIHDIDFQSP